MNDINRCFMFESRVPQLLSVVMVSVRNVRANTARVTLPQFGDRRAYLRFTDQQRPRIQAGRVIAAVVRRVVRRPLPRPLLGGGSASAFLRRLLRLRRRRRITRIIQLTPTAHDYNHNQERFYTEQLQVRSVLRHLALARGSSLDAVYTDTHWPTYQDLATPPGSPFWLGIPEALRLMLRNSYREVTSSCWRIRNSGILSACYLEQEGPWCSIIALTRQYQACLRRRGRLAFEECLSVQDFIDHLPDHVVRPFGATVDRGIDNLWDALHVLQEFGCILTEDGPPLTWIRGPPIPRTEAMRVFLPQEENIWIDVEHYDGDVAAAHTWNHDLRQRLDVYGPLTASLTWYPSYEDQSAQIHQVLQPSPEEHAAHLAKPEDSTVHTMLLTTHGWDEFGRPYYVAQDSFGDANNGDRGFLRFYGGDDQVLLLEYVYMA